MQSIMHQLRTAVPILVIMMLVYFYTKQHSDNPGLSSLLTSPRSLQPGNALATVAGPMSDDTLTTSTRSMLQAPPPQTNTSTQEDSLRQHMAGEWAQQRPITLHSDLLINQPDLCPPDTHIDYVMVVHTSTDHFDRREAIRHTFGNTAIFKNVTLRVVFLVGLPSNRISAITSQRIEQEAADHGDIVQGPFIDSYRNLTNKAVMGLRWVAEHCSHAEFVVRIDDDVFINVHKLVSWLFPLLQNRTRTILCKVVHKGIGEINRRGKWGIGERYFTNMTTYPFDMCNGFFAVMTSDLIRPMLQAVEVTPFLWVDDVYVYGMLADAVGGVTHMGGYRAAKDIDYSRSCFLEKGFDCEIVVLNDNLVDVSDVYSLWKSILDTATYDGGLLVV